MISRMESHFGSLLTPLVLDEGLRRKLQTIKRMDRNVYDVVPRPMDLVDYATDCFSREAVALGLEPGQDEIRAILENRDHADSGVSRIVNMRFSKPRPFPWTIDTVTDVHFATERGLMAGAGHLRRGPYIGGPDEERVPDQLQSYVELSLSNILGILNTAPYEPLIAIALAWNCISILRPFMGDGRMAYGGLLLLALRSRGFSGITRCPLFESLHSSEETIREGRRTFVESGDPNPMIASALDAVLDSYLKAYRSLDPLDFKKTVDGVSRSIIRHARGMDSFVLSDVHEWLGDISDQTFRARISVLIDGGILKKEGYTRNLRYIFMDPFEHLYRSNGGVRPYLLDDFIITAVGMGEGKSGTTMVLRRSRGCFGGSLPIAGRSWPTTSLQTLMNT